MTEVPHVEVWKSIPGYEGWYEVSSLGRIRSITRTINYVDGRSWVMPGRLLRWQGGTHGYPQVDLIRDGKRKHIGVHIVVALAFRGARPPDRFVCHKDGDKLNCTEDNLKYGTRVENEADKKAHGTANIGLRNGANKLAESDVGDIRRRLREKESQSAIAARFGVCQNAIHKIHTGKTWGWLSV